MVYGWVSTQPYIHLKRKLVRTRSGREGLKPLRTELFSEAMICEKYAILGWSFVKQNECQSRLSSQIEA